MAGTTVATARPPSKAAVWAGEQRLVVAATFFTVAVLFHNFDHLRRGGSSVSAGVFWLGSLAIINEVGVVMLAYMRHPRAGLAAVASGVTLAAGYVFVHFTPARSWLSDSFVSGHASPVSIVAASLETVAAVVLAVAGLLLVRRRAEAAPASAWPAMDQPTRGALLSTLRHPVVAAMVVGNLVIFVGSLLTR